MDLLNDLASQSFGPQPEPQQPSVLSSDQILSGAICTFLYAACSKINLFTMSLQQQQHQAIDTKTKGALSH
jgi:hypothetical protein